jgi:ribosomal 30S subunit maturation factor RimM
VVDVDTDHPQHGSQVGARLLLADGSVLTVARYEATDRSPTRQVRRDRRPHHCGVLPGPSALHRASERRTLAPDEFWPDELVGLEVLTREGEHR